MTSLNSRHDDFAPISARGVGSYHPPTYVGKTVSAAQTYDDQFYDGPIASRQSIHVSTADDSDQRLADQQWLSVKVFIRRLTITSVVHAIMLIMMIATVFWPIAISVLTFVFLLAFYWYTHMSKVRRVVLFYSIIQCVNFLSHASIILYLLSSRISRLTPYYYTVFVAMVFDTVLIILTLYNCFWLYRSFSITVIRF